MKKPQPISGFPEWTPAQTLAEQSFLRKAVAVYESYGYTPLDTPAVERVETLSAKGVVDKEIYALDRLKEESRSDKPKELGLRFDLTIPLARYVAMNYGELSFPFKRYQVGKVWRGERPQEGRFREFYQADIDVIAENELPIHFDGEMPRVILEIFQRQNLRARVRINNRKLLLGLYRRLEIADDQLENVLREADKLEKVGADGVRKSLAELGVADSIVDKCLTLASTSGNFQAIRSGIDSLGLYDTSLDEGLSEVEQVANALADFPAESWCCDLGIVRGLDYYTGTIYETNLIDYPQLGSICSGGRYDDLASGFINKKLPGVGISIGVSRLISYLFKENAIPVDRHCPTEVLIVLPDEEKRADCNQIADQLRKAGIATEIYHLPQALKKQLRYADRKGIPNVLFPHRYSSEEPRVEVKELASGSQRDCLLGEWLRKPEN
ncbi:MAG: histidine--tRNA ligase [Candidatus Eremiobacteraeota bacterium]|nr:histidine--tRNA ligase [Candidatus Eremiobacteraeota bacterium]